MHNSGYRWEGEQLQYGRPRRGAGAAAGELKSAAFAVAVAGGESERRQQLELAPAAARRFTRQL